MNKKALFLLILISSFAFAQIDYMKAFLYKADLSAKEAFKMQKEGVLLVDTRTKAEFKTLRAKNSINIPVFYEQNKKRVFNKNFLYEIYTALGKNLDKKVILICRSGSRTKLASNLLGANGFTNVYNVKQGFAYDWLKVNLPTEK